jgi:hypothetical protein
MKNLTELVYNILIGVNGLLLLLGIYEVASFLSILAILYSINKLISETK